MDNQKIKIVDGFVWLLITDKAKEVYQSGLFDGSIYALYDDDVETDFIETYEELIDALERGLEIAIEIGRSRNTDAVEDAKEVLRDHGYFVDNLWHIQNVQFNYMEASDEDAQKILNMALTNEDITEQISLAIIDAIELYFQDENIL